MMPHEFTPAAQRALAYATQWRRPRARRRRQPTTLGPAELLLGLLAEPECRAALLAAARASISTPCGPAGPSSQPAPPDDCSIRRASSFRPRCAEALQLAALHLLDYPHPHVLATEHLLLGLATGGNEVAQWLAAKGWDAAELAAEIDRLAGHDRGPLPIELRRLPSATARPAPLPARDVVAATADAGGGETVGDAAAERKGLPVTRRSPGCGFSMPRAIGPARRCA